jgi:hypothetical protein
VESDPITRAEIRGIFFVIGDIAEHLAAFASYWRTSVAKHKKMTAEDTARYQRNIDRLRELLEQHGGKRPESRVEPKS